MEESVDVQGLAREINEALILAVLENGAMHGYQIALEVEQRTGGVYTFQHGTLYPILHRLEKEKRLEGAWSKENGRRRKEYRPTPKGRSQLVEQRHRFSDAFGTLLRLLEDAT